MALIACPDCNLQISDRAPACPKCGGPITQGAAAPDATVLTVEPARTKKLWPFVLLAAVVIIGIFMVQIANDPDVHQRVTERDAIKQCWKEQDRESLSPTESRFIAGACEIMEQRFREKHHREP